MEKTNFRYMTPADIADQLDFASVDVSFISLTKILLPARKLLKDGGQMVCLIKPQFEAGREKVGKKGVVREPEIHEEVVHKILDFADLAGFYILNLEFSPIKGPEGNIEYLVYLEKDPERNAELADCTEESAEKALREIMEQKSGCSYKEPLQELIRRTVAAAHEDLDKS